ncbi:MAG: hypothetical protein RL556_627 [Actinomycetota bacterium]|jgi:lycopene cyclase domain-containing protein
MTYLLLNLVFTLIATIFVFALRSKLSRQVSVSAMLWLALMTLVFDNFIVGAGIVSYDPSKILNFKLLYAPVEDFGYLVVAVFLVPALWALAERRTKRKQEHERN